MADNVHAARSTHRKTFSFLSSSWFAPKFTLHPAGQRSSDSVPHEPCVDNKASTSTSAPPPFDPASPDNIHSPGVSSPPASSSHLLPPKANIHRHSMRLARKVKKFGRDSGDNAKPTKPKQRSRVIGDVLEDPYSLMTMSPNLLVAPSPSPSSTSFLEPEQPAGSLRRSATIGNQSNGLPLSHQSGAVQRARSVGAFPPLGPLAHPQNGERNLSPVVFAPREETSQPPSETSSAFYSESLVPSKPPSLIEEEEESPVSEVLTTAVSQRLRNVSSGSNGEKAHARLASSASSLSKAARMLGPSQDTLPEVVLLPASLHQQEPSGSSTSSQQQAPPIIRRRSPSPSPGIAILEGDLLTNPPQRTMSLRRAQAPRASRRRLSLDLRNLSPEPFKTGPARLKKSRSASAGSKRRLRPDAADELVDSYLEEDGGQGEPVDAKQHALDVRRAKKMVQLFGDKPPKELFKIHSRTRDDAFDTISILTTVSENRRESRATFTSVTSSISISRHLRDSVQSSNSEPSSPLVFSAPEGSVESHAPPVPEKTEGSGHAPPVPEKTEDSGKPEDKAAEPEPPTGAGTGTGPAPATPERAPPAAEESPTSPSRRSVHSRPGTPASSRTRPVLPALSLGSPALFSHSRSHSLHSQTQTQTLQTTPGAVPPLPTSPLSPGSAAPFSDLVPSHGPASPTSPAEDDPAELERERERAAAASPPPENFRARRIRAAKLSRFFGVAPHDLTDALANPPASPTHAIPPYAGARTMGRPRTPRQDMPSSFGSAKDSSSTPSLPLQSQSELDRSTSRERPSITVEVATEVPRPFRLGREKRPMQELDMEAVLDQLRRMR